MTNRLRLQRDLVHFVGDGVVSISGEAIGLGSHQDRRSPANVYVNDAALRPHKDGTSPSEFPTSNFLRDFVIARSAGCDRAGRFTP